MMMRALVAGVIVIGLSAPLHAQAKKAPVKASPSCATAPENAAWVKRQRELLAESPTKWTSDSLRTALRNAVGSAWTDAPGLQDGWMVPDTAPAPHDSAFVAVVAQLRGLARGAVGPSRTTVGVAGMRAVYVLALSDTALLRSMLHRIMEAGPDEGIKPDIALLEDRVRLMSGRKQLYGTQLHVVGGKLTPFAIEDSSHADLRREGAMLPPIAWSICNARHQLAR